MALTAIVIFGVLFGPSLLARYYWFYWDAEPTLRAHLPALPECYVPPGVSVDGFAAADVQAWLDADADSKREAGELPLPDVVASMVRFDYIYSSEAGVDARKLASDLEYIQVMGPIAQLTAKDGRASLRDFRAGCACHCWQGSAVAAWPPAGYEPTTPILVDLTSNEDTVSFGFRKKEPRP